MEHFIRNCLYLIRYVLLGATVLGVPVFVIGFYGPMIYRPEVNLGPLLGFIAGYLAAIVGGVAGFGFWVYWLWKEHKRLETDEIGD